MDPSGDLRRHLGLVDAAAIFVGIIVGSGIFVAPAAVAGATASIPLAVLFWCFGGIVAACGALCYAECGARLPSTGGFYVYHKEAYGEALAFVGGWMALLVTYPASIAAIALVFGEYLGRVAPVGASPRVAAAIVLVFAATLNIVGVRTGAWTQRLLTTLKVGVLALLCVAALLAAGAVERHEPVVPAEGGRTLATVLVALVVMLWTFDGWSDITLVTGEIRNPGRNLARTVFLGVGVLIVLYSGVQVAVMILLGPSDAAASTQVLSDAVRAGLGTGSGKLVAALILASTFGSIHAIMLTTSRLGYAMARNGVFLRYFGRVHPRWRTPARSVVAVLAAAVVYAWSGDFRTIVVYFSFSVWIFYGLTAVAVLILRRRGVGDPIPWRAPGGVLAPAVVLLTAFGITSYIILDDPSGPYRIGLVALALGFVVYAVWNRFRRRDAWTG